MYSIHSKLLFVTSTPSSSSVTNAVLPASDSSSVAAGDSDTGGYGQLLSSSSPSALRDLAIERFYNQASRHAEMLMRFKEIDFLQQQLRGLDSSPSSSGGDKGADAGRLRNALEAKINDLLSKAAEIELV